MGIQQVKSTILSLQPQPHPDNAFKGYSLSLTCLVGLSQTDTQAIMVET